MTADLRETMSVNEVLHHHPQAQTVFQQLFVNLAMEGSDCLDEVAWHHGMESEDLLASLAQEISERNAPAS